MNQTTKSITCAAFCFLLSSLSPPAAPSQDFSSIDSDLQQLQNLITDTLRNTEAHETLLQTLKQNLEESGQLIENYETTIAEQEKLLKDLQKHLDELSAIYKKQAKAVSRLSLGVCAKRKLHFGVEF